MCMQSDSGASPIIATLHHMHAPSPLSLTHTHTHTHTLTSSHPHHPPLLQTLEQQTDDPLKKLKEQSKGMVTCRICKGDHWTSKCPYKDTLGPATIKELEEQGKPNSQSSPSSSF